MLTEAQREFLSILAKFDRPVSRKELPLADRAVDKVRQECRKAGYAQFCGGWFDGIHRPMGWRITLAGRAALDRGSEQP